MIRRWPGRLRIRDKILGIIFFVVIFFGLFAIWQIRLEVSSALKRHLDRQGITVANDVAARSLDYIYTNNIFGLYLLIKDIVENDPEVRYIFIQDGAGNVIVSSFGRGVPAELLNVPADGDGIAPNVVVLETEEGRIHDLRVPLHNQTAEGGYVRVGMTEKGVAAALGDLTNRMLSVLLMATFLGMAIAYPLANLLSRPILTLAATVKEVGAGRMDKRVPPPGSSDEISELSISFNQMLDNLQEYNIKIRDFSRELVSRNEQLQMMSAELRQKEERLRYLLGKVITAQEEERRRIARELHDQTSQSLTSLMVGLRAVETAPEGPPAREARLRGLGRRCALSGRGVPEEGLDGASLQARIYSPAWDGSNL